MLKVGSSGIRRRHQSPGNSGCQLTPGRSPMPRVSAGYQQQSEVPMPWSGRRITESRRSASLPRNYEKQRDSSIEALLEKVTGIPAGSDCSGRLSGGDSGGHDCRSISETRIINIHPSLIPSFCGVGYYGLKVHEAALEAEA